MVVVGSLSVATQFLNAFRFNQQTKDSKTVLLLTLIKKAQPVQQPNLFPYLLERRGTHIFTYTWHFYNPKRRQHQDLLRVQPRQKKINNNNNKGFQRWKPTSSFTATTTTTTLTTTIAIAMAIAMAIWTPQRGPSEGEAREELSNAQGFLAVV